MTQTKLLVAAFALAGAALFTSCKDAKDETTETTTATETTVGMDTMAVTDVSQEASLNDDGSVTVEATAVPDSVRTTFTTKYPKAEKIVWKRYTPNERNTDARLVRDREYYYVVYYDNGTDYTSWYDNRGQWVKTSSRVPGPAQLPDAVNKTLNTQYAGYTAVEIDKENDKDMDMYEIELKKGEDKVKVKILPDGTIYKAK